MELRPSGVAIILIVGTVLGKSLCTIRALNFCRGCVLMYSIVQTK